MSPEDAKPPADDVSDREVPGSASTADERAVEVLLTVLLPLLITAVAFGAILLAFTEWKLY